MQFRSLFSLAASSWVDLVMVKIQYKCINAQTSDKWREMSKALQLMEDEGQIGTALLDKQASTGG